VIYEGHTACENCNRNLAAYEEDDEEEEEETEVPVS
jgi:hypothetical protein